MNNLILEIFDKSLTHITIGCTTQKNDVRYAIDIPTLTYEDDYTRLAPYGKIYRPVYINNKPTKVEISKELEPQYNKKNPSCYRMKIKFDDNVLYIPDKKFEKKKYKLFCFQNFVDIRLYNEYGELECSSYKFLANYDTRNEAIYYINKFAYRFAAIYSDYILDDGEYFVSRNPVLFHGDTIYEYKYIFKTKDGTGAAHYSFMVMSVEKYYNT